MAVRFPQPDTRQLTHAPLELVVFQVRYEPQLRAAESQVALAFHESIGGRDGAFPNIEPITGASLQVSFEAQGPTPPQVMSEPATIQGWTFTSEDGRWTVSLARDFAALQTTAYQTWSQSGDASFRSRLEAMIRALAELVEPRVEQRLGLRYVDRIRIPDIVSAVDWRPYIVQELLGLAAHNVLGPAVIGAQQQISLDLGERGVMCGLRHGFVRDPNAPDSLNYALDYDLYRQGGRPFDAAGIIAAADEFSLRALQLFQMTVTPELRDLLR